MILALVLAAALQAAPADTAGAYLDPGARELVELARERRERTEGRIVGYETVAKSRFTVGLRALHRERILWRCESAVRIHWQRDAVTRIEVLGKRQVAPIATAKPSVGEDPDCDGSSVSDPASDRLSITGMMELEPDSGDFVFVHPLARGSEADYRFRSGGTTTISLPGGKTIRLRELVVMPRRSDAHLFTGSLWLDDDSHGVVRAVLRLARPLDLVQEARDEGEGDDDIPGFLQPMTADLRYITLEYALWDGKYWLPRLVAFDGEAQVGRFANVPIRMEESYGAYEVEALPPGAPLPPRDTFAMPDSSDACKRHVSVTINAGEEAADSAPKVDTVGCQSHDGRCFRTQVVVNRTPEELLHSEFLPPSIYDEGDEIVSPAEMDRLMEAVKAIAPAPWQLGRPTLRWGWQAADLLRYNRVEGLSVGARAGMDFGRLTADATVRLGLASLEPSAEVGVRRTRVTRQQRLAIYDRLNDASIGASGLGLGNSLSALLLGRDGGDYFRSYGAELTGAPAAGEGLSWRLFAELQRPVERETDFNLPNLFGDQDFRENLHADRADQVGGSLGWRASRGLDPAGWRGWVDASVEASTGTFHFARPRLALTGAAPLPGPFVGSLQVAGGTSFGTLPAQSLWYLGGPSTVRGYTANLLSGNAYWRARAQVGPSFPGARIVLFSDAGWAGDRGDVRFDPPLLSAGVGLSFLDGLVRFDLSRALRPPTGWRLDLHVDAAM
ncbi:MAG TPA: ShlB/FhaC/HecB family hemolysin secretion/activation protein [Longimicrobiaceae bacterium]|nr:ShlB/FhaC/HecB family hemolysin secretion/activation protein [Longimicrobiaceae bacterium]